MPPSLFRPFHPSVAVATWFGAGLSPVMPGTVGSLAALPFAWAIAAWGGWSALAAGAVLVFAVGLWAAGGYMALTGEHDPGPIVVDEVAGQWIALLPASLAPADFIAGFVLFRLFDILKPWPISWADRRLPGAFGVMADDVLAGAFAAAGVWSLKGWLI